MPARSAEDRIRGITDQLVADITRAIQSAALEAVQEAMTRTEAAPRAQTTRRVVSKPAVRKKRRSLPVVELVPTARAARKSSRKVVSKPVTRKKKRLLPVVELVPAARAAKQTLPVVRKKRKTTPPSAPVRPHLDPEAIVAHIAEHPGQQRIEEIAGALGADARDVKRALQALKAEGRVHTTGKARGTTYQARPAGDGVIDDEHEALRVLGLIPATTEVAEEETQPAVV